MNKKLFLTLWLAGMLGTIAGLPYAFTLQKSIIAMSPLPLPALVVVSIIQTAILLAVVIYLGLRASRAVGLGAPYLEARLKGEKKEGFGRVAKFSIAIGFVVSVLIAVADKLFASAITIGGADGAIPLSYRLLASLYGGIVEELLLRLFLMAGIAWLITKISKREAGAGTMWAAIAVSTLVFGLGHLPATAALVPLTPLVVVRAIVLNGIGGIAFGWLYWKRGLEAAIVAHFSADIFIHALLPLLG